VTQPLEPALEQVAPVLGSTPPLEGVAPSLTEPALGETIPGTVPSFGVVGSTPGVALEQPVAPVLETGLGAGDILNGYELNTSALGIETSLPLTTTSPYPVLGVVESTGLLDPRAAVAPDAARDVVEATASYRPVVVVSEPQSTVTMTSSRTFSGAPPRLFDSSLGVGYMTELGGAASGAAVKFSQNDSAPSPLSPFGGLPFGALPAGSFFGGVGTGIGLDLLAILALLPLLVRASRLSQPTREVFKLVSSSRLVTELPG